MRRKSISTVSLRCAIIWFHSHEVRTGLHWMNTLTTARRMTFPGSCTDPLLQRPKIQKGRSCRFFAEGYRSLDMIRLPKRHLKILWISWMWDLAKSRWQYLLPCRIMIHLTGLLQLYLSIRCISFWPSWPHRCREESSCGA